MKKIYSAGGWLSPDIHFLYEREDQGQDFVIPWRGIIQAPGAGTVIRVLSDKSFPNGFGPSYPVVYISTGRWAHHEWYIGHCTSLVRVGESFSFGHPLARADQGYNFNGTHGGWVELGEAFGGSPDPFKSIHHWYRHMFEPLVVRVPDPIYKYRDAGWNILRFTSWLRTLGYLDRPWYHFNARVRAAVLLFQKRHKLREDGCVGPQTWLSIQHAVKEWKGRK